MNNQDHITEDAVNNEFDELDSEAGTDEQSIVQSDEEERKRIEDEIFEAGAKEYQGLLKMLLEPGFNVLAPNWNIQSMEIEQLSGAYAAVLQKYFPDGPSQFGPEIGAALVTLMMFAPRLKVPRKMPEKAANDEGPIDKVSGGSAGD